MKTGVTLGSYDQRALIRGASNNFNHQQNEVIMRESKNRKHEKVRASKANKAYRNAHSLTSRITMNRYKRITMESTDTEFVIVDGIVYT